ASRTRITRATYRLTASRRSAPAKPSRRWQGRQRLLPFGNRSVPKAHDVQTLEASAEQVRAAEELVLSAFRKSLDEYLKGRQDPRPQPADDRAIFGLADRAVRD